MGVAMDEIGFRQDYASRREHHIVGIMSGTSLDGIDACLVRILAAAGEAVDSVELLAHSYIPYSPQMRALVSGLCSPDTARIDDLTYVHFGLGEWYARAALMVIAESGIDRSRIDAISMHGQTVWHAPEPRQFPGPEGRPLPVKGTLQLGSAAVLRERTGLPVISEHRERDMAAGGEGAPLAPYIDSILFGSKTEGRIVQNIGGIGNATVLPAASAMADILAFDTGPGNMVMDAVVSLWSSGRQSYDEGGAIAARGSACESIVAELMRDPYFARRPPKSTGREVYGASFASAFMKRAKAEGLGFEDSLATATAFTAETIAAAYRDFILPTTPIASVLVAGGGALNATLLAMLRSRLGAGIRVGTTADCGIPDSCREAMAFAVLGHESLVGRPGNLPAVTGARFPVILGSITL